MTVTELGGTRIEREIDGIGTLVFEDCAPGQWLTAKGEPAKKPRRRYLFCDERTAEWRELDSVSSIVGTLDKPALIRWIERQATIGAVQAERLGELEGVPEEDWCYRVQSLGLGASAKKQEGADRGKLIHDTFEALALGQPTPNPADVPAIARPWIQGAMRAWLALSPEPVGIEQIVCHPGLGYAGRYDFLGRVDGRLTLVDWKSSVRGRVWPESHFQTRLYWMALQEIEGWHVERVVLVGVGDDGAFEIVENECSPYSATALVDVFNARKQVASGLAAQRKIARKLAA